MIARSDIIKIAKEIGEVADAERVILFGSQVTGVGRPDSDIDLLVIAHSDLPRHKRSREIYRNMKSFKIPVDIVVYTPDEVQKGSLTPVSFISQVLQNGETVYAR